MEPINVTVLRSCEATCANVQEKLKFLLHFFCHISRAVRRGIRITEKYLNEQKEIEKLKILDTDMIGRNIFHLSVQREELLELVLDKFAKV